MKYLIQDVDNNSQSFACEFPSKIAEACQAELQNTEGFRDAYRRVVSLQAWRARVFSFISSGGVEDLFLEAQNDALLSVVLAHMAMWRPALQSLRSCIENVLNTCYYVDHPVEFRLWKQGRFRIAFSELATYFSKHPNNVTVEDFPKVIPLIRKEYATLSKAVHASAKSFHMTKSGGITITNLDQVEYNKWVSRHSTSLLWINVVLVMLYSHFLTGSQNSDLRKSVSLAIPSRYHEIIASQLDVHLFPMEYS